MKTKYVAWLGAAVVAVALASGGNPALLSAGIALMGSGNSAEQSALRE